MVVCDMHICVIPPLHRSSQGGPALLTRALPLAWVLPFPGHLQSYSPSLPLHAVGSCEKSVAGPRVLCSLWCVESLALGNAQ